MQARSAPSRPVRAIALLSRHLSAGDNQVGRKDILLPSGKTRAEVPIKHGWQLSLQLDAATERTGGSEAALAAAIGGGADMRVGTNFPHAEHIDPNSGFGDLIGEVAGFQVTYLINPIESEPWVAGVMTLRQPIECPTGFGPRSSMSFFLYNQDGHQAIARPFLDGAVPKGGRSGPEIQREDVVAAAAEEKERKAQPGMLADPGSGSHWAVLSVLWSCDLAHHRRSCSTACSTATLSTTSR